MNNITEIKKQLTKLGVSEVYAYSRKSREDEDGEGLEKHRDILNSFCEQLNVSMILFEEVASSETVNREKLNELREEVRKRKVKVLLVYRLDRFTRKTTDNERLIAEFKFYDVLLIEVHREKIVDYKEALGIKLESIMSDLYQEQVKMVLNAGRRKAVQLHGNHQGTAPWGYSYNRETRKLEHNQFSGNVRDIFNWYLDGETPNNIAVKLNNIGLKTIKDMRFRGESIRRMLVNRKYVGTQLFGQSEWFKNENGKKFSKKIEKEKWIIYENAHEAIVDEATFEKVQELLKVNARTPPASIPRKYPLTQIIRCGKCGLVMTMQTKTDKEPNVRPCNHVNYLTGRSCGNKGIKSKIIEEIIKEHIWKIRPIILKENMGKSKKKKNIKKDKNSELKELQKREKTLNKNIDNLIDLQIENGKSERLFQKMKTLENQLEDIQEKIIKNMGEKETEEETVWVSDFLNISEELIGFPLNYKSMSNSQKNIFIRRYIESVIVLNKQVVEVVYTPEVMFFLKNNGTFKSKS